MKYSKENIIDYVKEEDVKFIRLFFIDIYGKQRNVSIMPNELDDSELIKQTTILESWINDGDVLQGDY